MATVDGKTPAAHDQFFTNPDVAADLVAFFRDRVCPLETFSLVIEPAAGAGAFYDLLPPATRMGVDIDAAPDGPYVRGDFLAMRPAADPARTLIIGNPPFGRMAAAATHFLEHSLSIAGIVALVLPRSFRKPFRMNRVTADAHVAAHKEIPPWSYTFEGRPRDVITDFFVWVRRRGVPRPRLDEPTSHPDFRFLAPSEAPRADDIAVARLGNGVGTVYARLPDRKRASLFFLRARIDRDVLLARLAACKLREIEACRHVASNPSMSRGDLVAAYAKCREQR